MKKPKVIEDLFTQCQLCKAWFRVRPEHEIGDRTIPLLLIRWAVGSGYVLLVGTKEIERSDYRDGSGLEQRQKMVRSHQEAH